MKTKLAIAVLLIAFANTLSAGELLDKATSRSKDTTKTPAISKPEKTEQILAIGLERTTHFVNERSAYCVIFRRDRRVTYHGIKNVDRIGKYEGDIWPKTFDRLADFVMKTNYFDLPDRFPSKTTDATQYILYVKTDKGEKLIWDPNFPDFANSTVWTLGELIDGLLSKTELNKVKKK